MKQPLVVSYGMGVDSTAVLVGFARDKIIPDLILFANTGSEADHTYAYRPVIDAWLASVGFPPIVEVSYRLKRKSMHWPTYDSLEENCLTNSTLPSLAFGFKSCSHKWKVAPQEAYAKTWQPAIDAWAAGMKIKKVIGYDAGPADIRRKNHLGAKDDPHYEYWYPLQDWGWDRARCKEEIAKSTLPYVPEKSACYFCPAMKPHELHNLTQEKLKRIVMIESRAKPNLKKIDGLWRKEVKGKNGATPHPGTMTQYIREQGLLDPKFVDLIQEQTPTGVLTENDLTGWPGFIESIQDAM